MKKVLSVLLTLVMLAGFCAIGAFAEDLQPFDIVLESGQNLRDVEIPDGYYVRSITCRANGQDRIVVDEFKNKSNNFSKCETITFEGSGSIYLNWAAFGGSAVKELYIPDNVYTGDYHYEEGYYYDEKNDNLLPYYHETFDQSYSEATFAYSEKLEKVVLDSSHYSVFEFTEDVNLKDVTLTEKVKTISGFEFSGCTSLKSITIPNSVTIIEDFAFLKTGLTSIYIPATVETIGVLAFGYVSSEWDNDLHMYFGEKVEGFTIYGHKDTAAEAYAIENGFTFVDVDDLQNEPTVYDSPGTVSALPGAYAEFDVTVGGSPAKMQFVNSKGGTITYTRDHENVTGITANANGSETWHVKLKVARASETYTIRLRYGRTWTDPDAAFTLTAKQPETGVVSAEVAASAVVGDPGVISVTAYGSPTKVQFTNSRGGTFTYTRDHASVSEIRSNGDGTETWTITLKVYRKTETYTARAKYAYTGWASGTASFTLAAE